MRNIALVLALAGVAALLAQSPSYHIAQTYTLGGEGAGTTWCPIHPITACSLRGRIA